MIIRYDDHPFGHGPSPYGLPRVDWRSEIDRDRRRLSIELRACDDVITHQGHTSNAFYLLLFDSCCVVVAVTARRAAQRSRDRANDRSIDRSMVVQPQTFLASESSLGIEFCFFFCVAGWLACFQQPPPPSGGDFGGMASCVADGEAVTTPLRKSPDLFPHRYTPHDTLPTLLP
jgi:hypothetical protein